MPNLPWPKNTLFALTVIATADTSQIVNVLHFEASGVQELTFTSDADRVIDSGLLADDWLAKTKTTWLAAHSNDYVISVVKSQVLEVKNQFRHKLTPVERPLSTGNAGTASVGSEATQVSANVKWRSVQAGKSHRGRTFLGPLPSTFLASGMLHFTGVTAVKAWADIMIATYGPGGTSAAKWLLTAYSRPYNQGEYSYPQGKNPTRTFFYPPDYAGNSTNITTGVVDPILRTQRRREVGVGS